MSYWLDHSFPAQPVAPNERGGAGRKPDPSVDPAVRLIKKKLDAGNRRLIADARELGDALRAAIASGSAVHGAPPPVTRALGKQVTDLRELRASIEKVDTERPVKRLVLDGLRFALSGILELGRSFRSSDPTEAERSAKRAQARFQRARVLLRQAEGELT